MLANTIQRVHLTRSDIRERTELRYYQQKRYLNV